MPHAVAGNKQAIAIDSQSAIGANQTACKKPLVQKLLHMLVGLNILKCFQDIVDHTPEECILRPR